MAFLPFIGPVFGVLDTVLKRVLPGEKMSEADKVQLAQQLQLELMKADWASVEREFADRADARALAKAEAAQGNPFTMALSAVVRPIWGLSSLVVVAYPYLAGGLGWPSVAIDEATKDIIQTVIMFYFGGKTVEKVVSWKKGAP
jgi:hypothetical protein